MADYRDQRVLCPYYRKPKGQSIRCEGYAPGMVVSLTFSDAGRQRAYMEDFCYSRCWRGCAIAQLAEDKYEK